MLVLTVNEKRRYCEEVFCATVYLTHPSPNEYKSMKTHRNPNLGVVGKLMGLIVICAIQTNGKLWTQRCHKQPTDIE